MDSYVLKPRPPVRAFVLAGLAAALGLVGLGLSIVRHAPALWFVLAAVVLAVGLALGLLALSSTKRMHTTVELDDIGYRITGPGLDKRGEWVDVTRMTSTHGGAHLTLHHGAVERTHIMSPGATVDPQMAELETAIIERVRARR